MAAAQSRQTGTEDHMGRSKDHCQYPDGIRAAASGGILYFRKRSGPFDPYCHDRRGTADFEGFCMIQTTKTEERKIWPVWVNLEAKVISFHEAEGFEKLEYASHEQLLAFAAVKEAEGFAFQ